jgi:outer membrane protein assembly factor BamB
VVFVSRSRRFGRRRWVWNDRVFVTTAVPGAGVAATFRDFSEVARSGVLAFVREDVPYSWRIVALDRDSGEILWQRVARHAVPRTARHVMASHANQTPVTDGTHGVAWFGSEGVYCYDVDGNLLWSKDLGPVPSGRYFDPGYEWNTASSPIIHENLVILQVDGIHEAYLLALDVTTGEEVWRTERDEHPSWPTPFIYAGATRVELITAAIRYARGYDPATGKELWRLGLHGDFPTPTPIAGSGLIFVTSAYGTVEPIYAIRPGASGDITLADHELSNDSVAWSKRRGGAGIPTPIVYRDLLYICRGGGILAVYETQTGERVYQSRISQGGNYSASPVAADGKIYFASEDGEVIVVKAGSQFERLAVNQMGEPIMATPAIAHGMMIFRMQEHVVAIATP